MRRVNVIGSSSGVGKTTFGRRLAASLGVPFVELDALFWRSGWMHAPTEEFVAAVRDVVRQDGWVIDGNYTGRLKDLLWQEADAIVWLDLPLRVALWRTVMRTLRRAVTREELWSGNRENLWGAVFGKDALFVYAIRTHRRRRRLFEERLSSGAYSGRTILRFRSNAEADRWLASLRNEERVAPKSDPLSETSAT